MMVMRAGTRVVGLMESASTSIHTMGRWVESRRTLVSSGGNWWTLPVQAEQASISSIRQMGVGSSRLIV